MILPSEELLREIMEIGTDSIIDDVEVYKNNILYAVDGQYADDINIYELMHLMKEWAVNKGFVVLSRNDSIGYRWTVILSIPSNLNFNKPFEQLSEFEAVIKACEWILKQKESK